MSDPAEYQEKAISSAAGARYFRETGGGDPYAAGLAYPVFLALLDAYPHELGSTMAEFREKFGFYSNPASAKDAFAIPLGFHLTTDPNTTVPWLVGNCQMCHAERLRLDTGDVIVEGLGNHRVRVHAYSLALARIGADSALDPYRIEQLAIARAEQQHLSFPVDTRTAIARAALEGLTQASSRKMPLLTHLSTGLPGRMATIKSFAMSLGMQPHADVAYGKAIGWAKVPDVRGFPYRDTVSFDASAIGSPEALTLEADFLFGARPEWYASLRHIATSMYLYLKGFSRHLPFPRKVDANLVAEGNALFDTSCAGCHGTYLLRGGEMHVVYKERVIPYDVRGTDPARADAVTPAFAAAANALPLTEGLTFVAPTEGYVPPVLLDVWARGLYGHAGQWPSLEVLAMIPAARPSAFTVDTEGTYDLVRVGVAYDVAKPSRSLRPGQYRFDGTQPGASVLGHPYLAELPAAARRAVVEYLKTL